MTERYRGFTVGLAKDIRDDDAEVIISAIKMIKGVLDVRPISTDGSEIVTEMRIKNALKEKVNELYYSIDDIKGGN
jgi:hypothetical protein